MNHPNNDGKPFAEGEEERPLIKENTHQSSTHSTQSEARVSQGLAGVRKAAKERKGMRFTALLHHLTPSERRFRDDGTKATQFYKPNCGDDRMKDNDEDVVHAGIVSKS